MITATVTNHKDLLELFWLYGVQADTCKRTSQQMRNCRSLPLILMTDSSIRFLDNGFEMIRIDAQGFHYRGQFIEDAGEAHRLLLEFLRKHQPGTDWRHAND